MSKLKGMGGHMDASLIAQARWHRRFFEQKAHRHEIIASELEANGVESYKDMARLAFAFGNLSEAFKLIMKEMAGEHPENISATKHRAIARSLREKGEQFVQKFRDKLRERGVYDVNI